MENPDKICLLVICGPTGAGKSGAAVYASKELRGEVVSADSMQVYKGMDIGTAKITKDEMAGVPHHMLDVVSPSENFSVSDYVSMASQAINDIAGHGAIPVVCGGTGLYISSLIDGIDFDAAPKANAELREALKRELLEKGRKAMYDSLKEKDPAAAKKIHPNDEKRVIRALEALFETGENYETRIKKSRQRGSKYAPIIAGINYKDRRTLYDKINARVDVMIEEGLLGEVEGLLKKTPAGATSMQAIGYKEMRAVISGEKTLKEAAEEIKMSSRRYAKRQLTWFLKDERITWFYADDPTYSPSRMCDYFRHALNDLNANGR